MLDRAGTQVLTGYLTVHSMPLLFRLVGLVLLLTLAATGQAQSLRFYGHGTSAPDLDRVKIAIDNPQDNNPGPPADVGSSDFTIEFWMRAATSGNDADEETCGDGWYSWIYGNILFDRDRYAQGRAFGISLTAGRVTFGVVNGLDIAYTLCGTSDVRDGDWHHVAVQRQLNGVMEIFVDGNREASANGPTGDISYPDDGVPSPVACNGPCTGSDPFIVIGAEKHDAGAEFPSFSGWLTEVRLSSVRRYPSASFALPGAPFTMDPQTAALYHFDERSGNDIVDANGNRSPGVRRFGGSAPSGPEWSTDTPFGSAPPDTGSIQFVGAQSVDEGAGMASITVTRSGGTAGVATVDVDVSGGSATRGTDYTFSMQSLRWAEGESGAKTVSVSINDDSQAEANETVRIGLSNVAGASLGVPAEMTLTITDNDDVQPPPPGGGSSGGGDGDGGGGGDSSGGGDGDGGSGGGGAVGGAWLLLGLLAALRRVRWPEMVCRQGLHSMLPCSLSAPMMRDKSLFIKINYLRARKLLRICSSNTDTPS